VIQSCISDHERNPWNFISREISSFWFQNTSSFSNQTSIRRVIAGWNLQCSHLIFASTFCEFSALTKIPLYLFHGVLNKNQSLAMFPPIFNTLVSARIRGFSKKKRLNARGFAWDFLRSGMLYRPGKSLKRCGKSFSLHSKKIFCLGDAGFLWVTS